MTKIIVLLTALTLVGFLTGCATVGKSKALDPQSILSTFLPPEFEGGDFHAEHHNALFDIEISVIGLRPLAGGKWTWSSFTYERKSHYATWSSDGKITLGPPGTTP